MEHTKTVAAPAPVRAAPGPTPRGVLPARCQDGRAHIQGDPRPRPDHEVGVGKIHKRGLIITFPCCSRGLLARVASLPPPAYPVCTARERWMSRRSSVAEVAVICRWTASSGLLPQARTLHASLAASHI